MTDKQIDFEIKFYEKLIEKKPDFVEALRALGDLYTKKGMYQKGLEIDEMLYQLRPEDPIVLYNLACSYSLLNNMDLALTAIKRAIKHGYENFQHLEQDQDLSNLHKDNRFQQYFNWIRQKKASSPDK